MDVLVLQIIVHSVTKSAPAKGTFIATCPANHSPLSYLPGLLETKGLGLSHTGPFLSCGLPVLLHRTFACVLSIPNASCTLFTRYLFEKVFLALSNQGGVLYCSVPIPPGAWLHYSV